MFRFCGLWTLSPDFNCVLWFFLRDLAQSEKIWHIYRYRGWKVAMQTIRFISFFTTCVICRLPKVRLVFASAISFARLIRNFDLLLSPSNFDYTKGWKTWSCFVLCWSCLMDRTVLNRSGCMFVYQNLTEKTILLICLQMQTCGRVFICVYLSPCLPKGWVQFVPCELCHVKSTN